jgi:hypothetical protein
MPDTKTLLSNSIDLNDAKEIFEILGKLNDRQKELMLASLRAAAVIADCDRKGAYHK